MKTAIAILFVLVVTLPGFAQDEKQKTTKASKPDFSGKWIVDLKKSEFMNGMPVSRIADAIAKKEGTTRENVSFPSISIEHRDPELRVIEEGLYSDRVEQEMIFFSDGRGETNTGVVNGSADSKTKWDGKRLVTTMFGKSDSGKKSSTIVARITWELSKDGKTLTKSTTPVDPERGTPTRIQTIFALMTVKMVYQRA